MFFSHGSGTQGQFSWVVLTQALSWNQTTDQHHSLTMPYDGKFVLPQHWCLRVPVPDWLMADHFRSLLLGPILLLVAWVSSDMAAGFPQTEWSERQKELPRKQLQSFYNLIWKISLILPNSFGHTNRCQQNVGRDYTKCEYKKSKICEGYFRGWLPQLCSQFCSYKLYQLP